ncbi:MAG: hypothetical protein KIT16_15530 [Rhodospirillaceae bacterium]|nr:hypothetical protein [Rhodospirillaceae bacterium]
MAFLSRRRDQARPVEAGDRFRRVRLDRTVEMAVVKTVYRDLLGIPHVRFELNLQHPIRGAHHEGLRALALSAFAEMFTERVPA